jgi:hypothetical protein
MAVFTFSTEVKQLFLDAYNDASIPAIDLASNLQEKLDALGYEVKLTKEMVRDAFENPKKLNKLYKNRPRTKSGPRDKKEIVFEDDVVTTDTTEVNETEDTAVNEPFVVPGSEHEVIPEPVLSEPEPELDTTWNVVLDPIVETVNETENTSDWDQPAESNVVDTKYTPHQKENKFGF